MILRKNNCMFLAITAPINASVLDDDAVIFRETRKTEQLGITASKKLSLVRLLGAFMGHFMQLFLSACVYPHIYAVIGVRLFLIACF